MRDEVENEKLNGPRSGDGIFHDAARRKLLELHWRVFVDERRTGRKTAPVALTD